MKSTLSSSPLSHAGHKPNLCLFAFAMRSSRVVVAGTGTGTGTGVRLTAVATAVQYIDAFIVRCGCLVAALNCGAAIRFNFLAI
jgi:hypothetical protein